MTFFVPETPLHSPLDAQPATSGTPAHWLSRCLAGVLLSAPVLLQAQDVGPPAVPGRDTDRKSVV